MGTATTAAYEAVLRGLAPETYDLRVEYLGAARSGSGRSVERAHAVHIPA
jgi:hypothetical protein